MQVWLPPNLRYSQGNLFLGHLSEELWFHRHPWSTSRWIKHIPHIWSNMDIGYIPTEENNMF